MIEANKSTLKSAVASDQDNSKRIDFVAFKTFVNICSQWQLKTAQMRILLGDIPAATFTRLKADISKGKQSLSGSLNKDTLERISYIMGIYKALHILLPTDAANAWIQQPNNAPQFNGQSALERMLKGNVVDVAVVRQYLDAERGAF